MRPYISITLQLRNLPPVTRIALAVVGVVFTWGGGLLLTRGVRQFITWHAAKGWTEVPASLTWMYAEGADGGFGQVGCRYTYTFAGEKQEGSRASPTPGSRDRYYLPVHVAAKFEEQYRAHTPVSCYVDPANPTRSVLYRDVDNVNLVGGFYVSSGIVGMGLLLVFMATYCWFSNWRKARRQKRWPNEPWRWRPEWNHRELQPINRANTAMTWVVAIFWNYIGLPIHIVVVIPHFLAGQYWVAILLLHLIIGIALLWVAARGSFRTARFRGSRLLLETRPVWIGRPLRATLVLSGQLAAISTLKMTLECVHILITQRSESRKVVWFERKNFPARQPVFGQSGLQIPIELSIPEDCPSTRDARPNDRIEWALHISGSLSGADLELDFSIPVFKKKTRDKTLSKAGS